MRKILHTSPRVEVFNTDIYVGVTPLAQAKMDALVKNCDLEVAWRGLVNRINDWTFIVEDIYLPKQVVTGASVEIEAVDMDNLRSDLKAKGIIHTITDPNEKVTRGLYFHGHSHVNMGVQPSAVDERARIEEMESNVPFFVWMIKNKSGETSCCVYIDNGYSNMAVATHPAGSGLLYRGVPYGLWDPEITNSVNALISEIPVKVSDKKRVPVDYGYDYEDYYYRKAPKARKQKEQDQPNLFTAEDGAPELSDDDIEAIKSTMTPSEIAEAEADGTFEKLGNRMKKERLSAIVIPSWDTSGKYARPATTRGRKPTAPKNKV